MPYVKMFFPYVGCKFCTFMVTDLEYFYSCLMFRLTKIPCRSNHRKATHKDIKVQILQHCIVLGVVADLASCEHPKFVTSTPSVSLLKPLSLKIIWQRGWNNYIPHNNQVTRTQCTLWIVFTVPYYVTRRWWFWRLCNVI